MYGQSENVLKEWKMLQDMKPPQEVFSGTKSQWMRRNTLNRRKFWQDFMKKSITMKDKFSPLFSQKDGYWFFDFQSLDFKKKQQSTLQKLKEQAKVQEQLKTNQKIEEQQNRFVPSSTSISSQQQTVEKPLRIVNTPSAPSVDEKPLVLIDTDIVAPQMPIEQAPVLPTEQAPVLPEEVQQSMYLEEEIKKPNKLPLILGSALVGLILLKTLK